MFAQYIKRCIFEVLNKFKNVDIQIKNNDAFDILVTISSFTSEQVQKTILNFLKEQDEWISTDSCGMTIKDHSEMFEYDLEDMALKCFPELIKNPEIPEFLEAICIWGFGYIKPCDQCGCEMEEDNQEQCGIEWIDWDCTNCENSESNEPDWDSMPGGKDF